MRNEGPVLFKGNIIVVKVDRGQEWGSVLVSANVVKIGKAWSGKYLHIYTGIQYQAKDTYSYQTWVSDQYHCVSERGHYH